MDVNDAIRRIKKCLALSKSSNEGEAAAALRQAQKLMAAFNISEEGVHAAEVNEETVSSRGCWTSPPSWEVRLVMLIAGAFGCKVMWTNGSKQKGMGFYTLIGIKHQVGIAKYAFQVLHRQVIKDRGLYVETLPDYWTRPAKAASANTFCEAYVARLAPKVAAITLEPEQAKAVEANYNARSLRKGGPARTGNGDARAAEAGAAAGDAAHLHRPMQGTPLAPLALR